MVKQKNATLGVAIAAWILLAVNVHCPKASMMEYDVSGERDCAEGVLPKFWLKTFKGNGLFKAVGSQFFEKNVDLAEREFIEQLSSNSMTWLR